MCSALVSTMSGFVVDSMSIPGVKVPVPNERVLKIVMSPELGNHKEITLLLSLISPHSKTGLHTHDSDEIMYVATGEGESTMDGKSARALYGQTPSYSLPRLFNMRFEARATRV